MSELSLVHGVYFNRARSLWEGVRLSFESVQNARNTTLAFSDAINRLLDVGVLVSELAETADK
jgi:hypothetical protein